MSPGNPAPAPIMLRRVAATQATLDRWQGVAFDWGSADCARMVAGHLRELGLVVRIGKAGSYASALGGSRALRRAGFADLPAALDAHGLVRIAPAATVVGDVLALPADPHDNRGFAALAVALGNGRVLCWHPDAPGAVVCQPLAFEAAWSVL